MKDIMTMVTKETSVTSEMALLNKMEKYPLVNFSPLQNVNTYNIIHISFKPQQE